MEEHQTYTSKDIGSTHAGSEKTLKETFRSGSPDDVRDKVKDVVQKGIAAVAGALKGFSEEAEREDLPGTTKSAIQKAGETTRSTVSSATEEAKNLKEPLRQAGHKLSETARDIRGTVKEEVDRSKEAIRGGGGSSLGSSSGGSSLSSSGSTYPPSFPSSTSPGYPSTPSSTTPSGTSSTTERSSTYTGTSKPRRGEAFQDETLSEEKE